MNDKKLEHLFATAASAFETAQRGEMSIAQMFEHVCRAVAQALDNGCEIRDKPEDPRKPEEYDVDSTDMFDKPIPVARLGYPTTGPARTGTQPVPFSAEEAMKTHQMLVQFYVEFCARHGYNLQKVPQNPLDLIRQIKATVFRDDETKWVE